MSKISLTIPKLFDEKIIGMHIGSYKIQIVVSKRGKILQYISIPTPVGCIAEGEIKNNDLLVSIIKKTLIEKFIKVKKISICIDSSFISVREMRLPLLKKDELIPAAEFELQQTYPGINQTHAISFKEYYRDSENVVGIVSSCPLRIIDGYVKLVEQLGLIIQYIDVSANCITKVYNHLVQVEDKNTAILIVDIGHLTSQVNVISDGRLVISRNVHAGGNNIVSLYANHFGLSTTEALDRILRGDMKELSIEEQDRFITNGFITIEDQIRQTLDFYKYDKNKKAITMIWLTGGGSNIVGLKRYYNSVFNIETSMFKPASKETLKAEEIDQFSLAIGATIREA